MVSLSEDRLAERNKIVTDTNRGRFWKSCPGTGTGYYCCGYQVLTPLIGCGMYCRYCILQDYNEFSHHVEFKNWDDLEREVQGVLKGLQGKVVRVGTGEFADSLYLEDTLGLSQKVARLLNTYDNVLTEFKTKSINVLPLKSVAHPAKNVIAFSMNTPRMISTMEVNTASVAERLQAAKWCVDQGFWVAFHFDPMFWYPQWKKEYQEVVQDIFSTIKDANKIAWWSLGGFRTVPALKARLKKEGKHLPLFSGELVLGEDKKYRYFRSIRVELYEAMREAVDAHAPDTTLYLCMESPEVWAESGLLSRIPKGLVRYLDDRAKMLLELAKERSKNG